MERPATRRTFVSQMIKQFQSKPRSLTPSLPLSRRYPARLCRLPSGCPAGVFSVAVAHLVLVKRMHSYE